MAELRILVVDDHPIVRKGLVDLFDDQPDMVVVGKAATIEEATAVLGSAEPDVAVVDLILGQQDGMALVSTITKLRARTRVLVLSTHDERLYAHRALKAGATGYIMKDAGVDALLAAVRSVAVGKVYVSERVAERIVDSMAGARSARSGMDGLTDRELQVFRLLGQGKGTREIAGELGFSIKTAETHIAHLKEKLGASNTRELLRLAIGWAERGGSSGPT